MIAEVQTTDVMDRFVVRPGLGVSVTELSHWLMQRLPSARIVSGGFPLEVRQAISLLETDNQNQLHWSPDALLAVHNRQRVYKEHDLQIATLRQLSSMGATQARFLLQGLPGLGQLDEHQFVNVAAMTQPNGYGLCVFDEQGAGKTVTGIFGHDVLVRRGEVTFLLIVAPKSMVPEWQEAYKRFQSNRYKVVIAAGTRAQKQHALSTKPNVVVTNYETVINMETELRSMLRAHKGRAMLIIDESFLAKSLNAQRTRALRRLREWCTRAFVLCGTPAPNAPHDLIQQFNIVDFGLTFDGVSVPDDKQAAIPVVQRAIEERGLYVRNLKSDVLPDLPGKRYHRVLVSLAPEQRRLYAGALRDLIVDLRSTDDQSFQRQLTSFFARRSALLQICSNPASVAEGYSETPAKICALDSILERAIIEQGEKVVLWSFYTASINTLATRYAHYGAVRYDGQVSNVAERRESVRRFQEDDTTMLFIGNPAAAGAGLTLHRARLAVYESMSNQAAHYLQSLDRIHRRGQEREVEYTVLLCDQTIELSEYDRLVGKERDAQRLLGDHVDPPVTRETMLAEAETAGAMLGEGLWDA